MVRTRGGYGSASDRRAWGVGRGRGQTDRGSSPGVQVRGGRGVTGMHVRRGRGAPIESSAMYLGEIFSTADCTTLPVGIPQETPLHWKSQRKIKFYQPSLSAMSKPIKSTDVSKTVPVESSDSSQTSKPAADGALRVRSLAELMGIDESNIITTEVTPREVLQQSSSTSAMYLEEIFSTADCTALPGGIPQETPLHRKSQRKIKFSWPRLSQVSKQTQSKRKATFDVTTPKESENLDDVVLLSDDDECEISDTIQWPLDSTETAVPVCEQTENCDVSGNVQVYSADLQQTATSEVDLDLEQTADCEVSGTEQVYSSDLQQTDTSVVDLDLQQTADCEVSGTVQVYSSDVQQTDTSLLDVDLELTENCEVFETVEVDNSDIQQTASSAVDLDLELTENCEVFETVEVDNSDIQQTDVDLELTESCEVNETVEVDNLDLQQESPSAIELLPSPVAIILFDESSLSTPQVTSDELVKQTPSTPMKIQKKVSFDIMTPSPEDSENECTNDDPDWVMETEEPEIRTPETVSPGKRLKQSLSTVLETEEPEIRTPEKVRPRKRLKQSLSTVMETEQPKIRTPENSPPKRLEQSSSTVMETEQPEIRTSETVSPGKRLKQSLSTVMETVQRNKRTPESSPRKERKPSSSTRGRPRGRGRGRRPAVGVDLVDISELPAGEGLETRLHPKRRRPKGPKSASSSSSEARPPQDEEPSVIDNYGSEEDSDDDDDDDDGELASQPVFIPRAARPYLLAEGDEELPIRTPQDTTISYDWPLSGHASSPTVTPQPATSPNLPPVTSVPFFSVPSSPNPFSANPVSPIPSSLTPPTSQNLDKFKFDWRPFPQPQIKPELRRERFSDSNVGPTVSFASPYDAFTAIWDRKIMEHIAVETNTYAQQLAVIMLEEGTICPSSRITKWYDTDADELHVYLAIVLATGVVIKTRLEEYWNTAQDMFITPGFSASMSINRFLLLSKCLHFQNNEGCDPQSMTLAQAKLFKVQPILDHLNDKFSQLYVLSRNIALDESLTMWKGWLSFNQFIRTKAGQVGIKTYELCEAQTGYLWRFAVHVGQDANAEPPEDSPVSGVIPTTVLKILNGLENKGHTIWMDNYYNSPALAREMKVRGFDCVGTLRTDREFVPAALAELRKEDMEVGQVCGCTSGDVDLVVWRDKNRVAFISTYHGLATTMCGDTMKPTVADDYNICMGGVDRKDQMLAMFPIERKRNKVWYKKFFRRLLNDSVLNAFILYKYDNNTHKHRSFRKAIVEALIARHGKRKELPLIPTPTKSAPGHFPAQYGIIARRNVISTQEHKRRACVVCKKRTNAYCMTCDVPLCVFTCFEPYHIKTVKLHTNT